MRASVCRRMVMLLVCAAVLLSPSRAMATAEPEDAAALWREAYESLNGEKNADGKLYPTVNIPEGLQIELPTEEEEVLGLFRDGTGILYFGFPECPWCRTLLPVLTEVLAEHPEISLFCYDLRADRDEYRIDASGEFRQTREGTGLYIRLLSLLDGWIGPYEGLNDDSLKRIYMPTLVFLKNGVVRAVHINTVDGQKSGYDPLTDQQREELKAILEEAIGTLSVARVTLRLPQGIPAAAQNDH